MVGLTRLARDAGRQTAASATTNSSSGTLTNTSGSHGFTPYEKARDHSAQTQRCRQSDRDAAERKGEAVNENHPPYHAGVCAERKPDRDLARALLHGVRHQSVDPDRRQQQRRTTEDGHQERVEPLTRRRT